MKPLFTRFLKFIVTALLPVAAFGQQTDYTIALNTGKFVPAENVTTVSKQSAVYQQTYFAGKNYLVLQFNAIPTQAEKDRLNAAGIVLIDYLPKNAYTAVVPAGLDWAQFKTYALRSVLYLTADQKAYLPVLEGKAPLHAVTEQGYVNLQVLTYEKLSSSQIVEMISSVAGRVINEEPMFRMFSIRVPKDNVRQLAELPFIQWIEFADPPNQPENKPGVTQHHVNVLQDGPRNLKGDGMNVGAWDERCFQHLDFSPAGRMVNVDAGASGQHGTHLSGTIAGRGLINPFARGMAPNATLYSYYGYDGASGGGHFDNNLIEMATEIPAKTLVASNHSYHDGLGVQCVLGGVATSYSLRARNADLNLNNHTYHLHCHSAGNAQASCASGWFSITGTGKAAKNNIVVGALTSTDGMTSFSSFGPVNDGRVKPEICAFGNGVLSTNNSTTTPYASLSGTSMATPGIAGTLTLVSQRYKQLNGNVLPSSALVKNVACNTAQDLGNPGPDYRFGFGRVNALKAIRIFEENRYALNTVAQAGQNDVTLTVPAGAAKLNVMLTWNDPAGAANSATPLVNNLDLTVSDGTTTTLPWILNPASPASNATKAVDNISNIEQVTIDNPPAGNYVFRVTGTSIASGPTQSYALTWNLEMPYIEVTFPNGNESFNPGSAEIISWDNAGVTGNQTVEYSTNNGGTWNTIGTVSAATTRLSWTVPAGVNTSTALVRVTSGALTDASDATFKILGTVTGFAGSGVSCNAGEVIFTWTAVANATHYDIYKLDPVTGEFVIAAANITGSPYTLTGLTPNTSMWFTIRSKNNTTLAESERAALSINVTTSNGGGGLGAVGSIAGQSAVCGNQTGLVYSIAAVSGATSYTWTVPAGATIVSGQGTISITVNFTAGTTGNISVSASNGTCQTAPSTLAVTSGNAAAAPTGGGDQLQNVCPGGVVPTLTATATVPAGYTVVWYTAATGGTVVASPTLSAAGTVTYYAASRETATGCESATRTAVTLTITQVPTASITAGGNTTFCQGGNVVLTANTGGSYLWSNGATTQSITVSAAGTFSVQVTTGSCVSTSPNTVVTVNPTPAANISAGGPLTFCQGLNVVLTASAGSSWLWSNGATTQAITVTSTGNYSVTVTNASGCSATSAATSVTVNPNPAAVISAGSATTFCQGGSVVLTANAGASYLWSNGATTQSITINGPVGTANYSVQVTQAGGCVSSSPNTAVTVNATPAANISAGGPVTFCQGNNVVLTASAGNSWLWSNGATTQSITVGTSGSYSVTVTSAAGCSASSSSTAVAVSPNPSVSIAASPYTNLYPGLSTTLTAVVTPPGSYNYAWFKNGIAVPGGTTPTLTGIDLSDVGSYTVTVTNTTGLPCSNTSAAVAIADSATTKLFIYPSPNAGQFSVAYYTPGTNAKNTIVVYDSKGAHVYTKSYSLLSPYQVMSVDMRQHARGIYRVVLFDRTGKKMADGSVVLQ